MGSRVAILMKESPAGTVIPILPTRMLRISEVRILPGSRDRNPKEWGFRGRIVGG